jgi:hypothetical protein
VLLHSCLWRCSSDSQLARMQLRGRAKASSPDTVPRETQRHFSRELRPVTMLLLKPGTREDRSFLDLNRARCRTQNLTLRGMGAAHTITCDQAQPRGRGVQAAGCAGPCSRGQPPSSPIADWASIHPQPRSASDLIVVQRGLVVRDLFFVTPAGRTRLDPAQPRCAQPKSATLLMRLSDSLQSWSHKAGSPARSRW